MYNKIFNKIKKILLKIFYYVLAVITLIYLGIGLVLFYIGPWETRTVKQNLKKNPIDIVVSFTTTPYRIDKIKPVLDSISNQSIKPTRVYVNVPYEFKRNNAKYIIPDWLKNYPNIIINRTKDYGPATKLIGTLEKEHDPNTIIITVDDDTTYPKHIVRDLAKQYLPGTYKINYNSNAVITGIGVNYLFGPNFDLTGVPVILDNSPSLVVVGFGGVSYKRKFFKDDIFSLPNSLPLSCFLGDDVMISAYLIANNINIVKTFSASYNPLIIRILLKQLPVGFKQDALHKGANGIAINNDINYSNCLTKLPKYNKAEYQTAMIQRSKMINSLYQNKTLRNCITKSFYDCLYKIISEMPFMEKIIASCMG